MLDVQRYVVHRVRQQVADPAATTHVLLQQPVLRYRNSMCCSHRPRLLQQRVLRYRNSMCCSAQCASARACISPACARRSCVARVRPCASAGLANVLCTAARAPFSGEPCEAVQQCGRFGSGASLLQWSQAMSPIRIGCARVSTHAPLCDGRGEDDRQQVVHVARACSVS
jgi:hypothetical protein